MIAQPRVVVWFSCGAASAVTAKIAIGIYQNVHVVYCDTAASEHEDNQRFLRDVEKWIGRDIIIIKSKKYSSIDDVFTETRYMAGQRGARCTVEMKKIPRFDFQLSDDIHAFGYTADEQSRIETFVSDNPELNLVWPLRDEGIHKVDCFKILKRAGISLPKMYILGYEHNNCIGCVKASAPSYWNKVKADFPDIFAKRLLVSREIGAKLTRRKTATGKWERIYLDELEPENQLSFADDLSCGPECASAEELER